MLTKQELEDAVRTHIGAEAAQDLEELNETLEEGVVYDIMAPCISGDSEPYGRFSGAATYLNMWRDLYQAFTSYEIELLEVNGDEEGQRAWLVVHVTAVPTNAWQELEGGKAIEWWAAAICEFAPDGRMTREVVYGSLPPTLVAYQRMLTQQGQS